MPLQTLELLPIHVPKTIYGTAGAVAITLALILVQRLCSGPNHLLDHVPTIGSNSWLGAWAASVSYIWKAHERIEEGYKKHKGTPFKLSTPKYWMVVVSGQKYVEEFNQARNEDLDFLEGVNMTVKSRYTLGRDLFFNPYHMRILRLNLTRNLADVYPDLKDELITAFDESLQLGRTEWKSVPGLENSLKVISRSTGRMLVGLPLCHDPDWIDLNIRYTIDLALGAFVVNFFPEFMGDFVVRNLTSIPGSVRRGVKLLSPIIDARWKQFRDDGSWAGCPNDFLTWLMQEAEGSERETEKLVRRILSVSFAAIHNVANALTESLYNLAINPQYVQPLREEVEKIVAEEGWTKASLAKMHKVDSFNKETQRLNPTTLANMVRTAMKDFTFSDGTMVPKGTYLIMAAHSTHLDEENYDNPRVFDPFRFSNMRKAEGAGLAKHGLSTTTPDYLVFGHGRHSCPGRFLVSDELNTLLAHIVLTYDIKLEDSAMVRPPSSFFGIGIAANRNTRIMFRRRVV